MSCAGVVAAAVIAWLAPAPVSAQSLGGVWKVVSVIDYNEDGSIRRYTFGKKPYGFVVAQGGWCSVEITATETPEYDADKPIGDQIKPTLLSSFIGYAGPCSVNEAEKFIVVKIQAGWLPHHDGPERSVAVQGCCAIGSEQKRYYKFDGPDRLIVTPSSKWTGVRRELVVERLKK
jgi:hypothetical protein